MATVEPERFDDVEFRVVEGPDPPRRPPRIRRGVLALGAGLLAAGALAAGASALGGGEEQKAADTAPVKPRTNIMYTDRGTPYAHDGRECEAGKRFGKHRRGSSEPRD
jgi:hypothetical protein